MSINRVSISGNLTRNAELRMTQSGKAVVSFGVAVNDRRKNAQGQWEDYANFLDCVVFGKYAEALEPRLQKGAHVFIDGQLRYQSWDDQNGNRRSKVEIVVNTVEVDQRNQQQPAQRQAAQPAQQPAPQQPANYGYPDRPPQFTEVAPTVYDVDIPF